MPIERPFAVIPLVLTNITSGNEVNRPAANLGCLKHAGMTWKSDGNADLWVRGQFDTASDVNFVSMVAANALPGTTIRVRLGTSQAEVDGTAPYDSGAISFISPSITRDDGLYHSHLELPDVETASWWRIDIAGHTGDFEAAGLVLGKMIQPSRFYDKDYEYGVEDLGGLEIARNGVTAETPGIVLRTLLFRLSWVTKEEFESDFRPMIEQLGARGVTFWCLNPEANAYRQAETYMGYFGRAPYARGGVKPRTFAMEFQIRSII